MRTESCLIRRRHDSFPCRVHRRLLRGDNVVWYDTSRIDLMFWWRFMTLSELGGSYIFIFRWKSHPCPSTPISVQRKAQVGSWAHPRQISRPRPCHLRKGRSIGYSRHWQKEVLGASRLDRGTVSLCHSKTHQAGSREGSVPVLFQFHPTQRSADEHSVRRAEGRRRFLVHSVQWRVHLWRVHGLNRLPSSYLIQTLERSETKGGNLVLVAHPKPRGIARLLLVNLRNKHSMNLSLSSFTGSSISWSWRFLNLSSQEVETMSERKRLEWKKETWVKERDLSERKRLDKKVKEHAAAVYHLARCSTANRKACQSAHVSGFWVPEWQRSVVNEYEYLTDCLA